MNVDVSIVVCTYDDARWDHLQAAVRSVDQQSYRPTETILVVDHNPSLLARAQRELPGVTVMENSDERGVAGARNSGIAASSGSVVAFLDDDGIACSGWLKLLVERYADPAVAGVGGSVQPLWETGRPSWFPSEFDWVVGCSYRGTPQRSQEVRNLFGGNMSFRRDLLNIMGGFRLGYSCDETELCIRIRQQWPWMKLIYIPGGKVLHHIPSDRARLQRFLARCYYEGGSKVVVSTLVGAGAGLSSERRYVRETLPEGAKRSIEDFIRRGDLGGLARATTILAGLTATTLGYVSGGFSISRTARRRGWRGGELTRASRRTRRSAEAIL